MRSHRIVITAPLTEIIDHAGYFIQMSVASLPVWLEGIIDRKYPSWRKLEWNEDGSARYMPAGARVLEASLLRRYAAQDIVCCYPDDLDRFIGPDTRVVAVSTHNPMGVTFAAGVYTSIFGSAQQPINSHYSRKMFERIKSSPHRRRFKVIVGGSGGWQIAQTNAWEDLSVDCVVEGRSESIDTLNLFDKALAGEPLPRQIDVHHPKDRESIIFPDKRTTFGVVEMTTGCGRRCQFCLPDLNPQIDLPKDRIMASVHANVRDGNKQISLATEDMFIWGQVRTNTPFYFPNREALLDLYGLWAWKLRRANGPSFTWPLLMFANALPESWMAKMGRLYEGRPLAIKTRKELLATIKPSLRQYLRADTGDIPEEMSASMAADEASSRARQQSFA